MRRGAWSVALVALTACGGPREPRSIVLVTVDTLRADHLGSYGGKAPTPSLDALAREGARFENVFAQSPLTLPSHSSILTGTYPTFHGVHDNGRFRLPADMETLAEILKGAGYETAAFVAGFPVDSRFGLDQGFDLYDDALGRSRTKVSLTERRAEEVVPLARSWIEGRGSKLYFVWVHLFDPHAPYDPPDPYSDTYDGEVSYTDSSLKNLMEVVARDAILAVTSDHGEGLGEHGESTHSLFVYDSTLRVPLLLRGPGVAAGAVIPDPARSIDLVPTILDLVGLGESCPQCQGRSLVPAIEGGALPPETAYAETYFPRLNLGWSELRSLRSEGFKYIDAPEPELYNIAADPGELRNLAAFNPEKVRELDAELDGLEKATAGTAASEGILDSQVRATLRSLGYLTAEAPAEPAGPRPDPKSRLAVWEGVRTGMDLTARGDTEGAIDALESALANDPDLVLARTYLALAYFESGRYEKAADQCREILARSPGDFDGALLLGKSLLRLGRVREAREALELAARIDGESPEPWVELTQLHLASKSRAEADAALARARAIDANAPSLLLLQGKIAMMNGSAQYAEKLFRAAIEAAPFEDDPRVQLGNLLLSQRRLEEAEDLYRESLIARPQAAAMHLGLGHTRALSGRMDQAIPSFEKALELSPESTLVLNSLAFAYLETGEREKGEALLRRSLQIQPAQPELASLLGAKK